MHTSMVEMFSMNLLDEYVLRGERNNFINAKKLNCFPSKFIQFSFQIYTITLPRCICIPTHLLKRGFKGTVSVISIDPPCKEGNVRFTMVTVSVQLYGRY